MQGADLLFAFDDDLHVQRKRAGGVEPRTDPGQVQQQPRLVVDDAAAVEPSVVANRGLEGGREPAVEPPRRLHVVMGVDQRGGRTVAGTRPLAHDIGMGVPLAQDLDAFEPGLAEKLGHLVG